MRVVEREIASALIFSKDGKLLQVKNAEPTHGVYGEAWVIPGGGIEEGETAEEAVIREVMEEVGIDISSSPIELVWTGNGESPRTLKSTGEEIMVKMRFSNFRVQLDQDADDVSIVASDEHHEYLWAEVSSLRDMVLSQPSIECLTELGYL
jgi:8-oxo-dGTP pyrophosphatase MutT (NUDIX family)